MGFQGVWIVKGLGGLCRLFWIWGLGGLCLGFRAKGGGVGFRV